MRICLDMKVLGGLTVEVTADVDKNYCDWWITSIAGRNCKKSPEWLYRRLKQTGEDDRIKEECFESRAEYDYWGE